MAIVAGAGRAVPGKLALAGAVCAMLPDVDVIGFRLGIRYEDLLGHRGLTHSVAFAAAMATVLVGVGGFSAFGRRRVWACLVLCGVSHGLLDAATNGGLGIAFWSPFSNVRYFLPWRPMQVSPIGLTRIFS